MFSAKVIDMLPLSASGKPLKILPDAMVKETNRQFMQQARTGTRTTRRGKLRYFIVGITNSAPSRTPLGQRDVTVFVRV